MAQQPDKLFRDKLRPYGKQVPEGAWNRVSENLRQKRKTYPWLRIAAALLLLCVAVILLLPFPKNDMPGSVAVLPETSEQPGRAPRAVQKEIEKDSAKTLPENKAVQDTSSGNPESHLVAARQQRQLQARAVPRKAKKQAQVVPDDEVDLTRTGVADHDTVGQRQAPHRETVASTKQSFPRVTIVFSAEEVNDKYLDKKEMADATPETKPASSLRKLLDKAYALKHNQDPLGELRQKKNEILAFNFKDDKPQHE